MADSFNDFGDENRPQFSDGVFVEQTQTFISGAKVTGFGFIITAPNVEDFLFLLESFSEIFDLDEFKKIINRIKEVSVRSNDLIQNKNNIAAIEPNWVSKRVNSISQLRDLQDILLQQLNTLRGYTVSDADVITDLIDLVNSKVERLAKLSGELQDLIQQFTQSTNASGIYGLNMPILDGGNSSLRYEILRQSPLNELNNPYSAGFLVVGGVGDAVSTLEGVDALRKLLFP